MLSSNMPARSAGALSECSRNPEFGGSNRNFKRETSSPALPVRKSGRAFFDERRHAFLLVCSRKQRVK
jgi:hypothetical protein